MTAYSATISPYDEIVLAEEEVCDIRWIGAEEVETMKFFPEYKDTLTIYFQKTGR